MEHRFMAQTPFSSCLDHSQPRDSSVIHSFRLRLPTVLNCFDATTPSRTATKNDVPDTFQLNAISEFFAFRACNIFCKLRALKESGTFRLSQPAEFSCSENFPRANPDAWRWWIMWRRCRLGISAGSAVRFRAGG